MRYMDKIKHGLKFIATMILIGTYGFLVLVFYGFVLSVLWGWFIVPLGIASITVPQAVGIAAVVNLFRFAMESKLHENLNYKQKLALAVVAPAMLLLFGYIVTLFM